MAVKKKVLGRGLGALIGEAGSSPSAKAAVESTGEESGNYLLCPIDRIKAGKMQPRKSFDKLALSELSESIKENGIIEPLVVRRDNAGFSLIAGERRLRAARQASLKDVPVVVLEVSDRESLELAIVENIQREDLSAIEEAEAYRSLMEYGLSQQEVAKKVGKERATVSNYIRLLALPPEVKDEIANSNISMGHARALLTLEGHGLQREVCRKIIKNGLSVRETERLCISGSAKKKARKKDASATHLEELEAEFRKTLGTKVSVTEKRGKGKIEVHFYSKDERERIIELLRSIAP